MPAIVISRNQKYWCTKHFCSDKELRAWVSGFRCAAREWQGDGFAIYHEDDIDQHESEAESDDEKEIVQNLKEAIEENDE